VDKTKPFEISKHVVMDAYKRVKANKGAAGIDDESIHAFEENLKDNLYNIWNRMSSGSYFPPPVKVVEIPKKNGGVRILGVPTVLIGSPRWLRSYILSRRWSRVSIQTHMATGLESRQ
jgi:RNA-directed DNA polymerase